MISACGAVQHDHHAVSHLLRRKVSHFRLDGAFFIFPHQKRNFPVSGALIENGAAVYFGYDSLAMKLGKIPPHRRLAHAQKAGKLSHRDIRMPSQLLQDFMLSFLYQHNELLRSSAHDYFIKIMIIYQYLRLYLTF